MKQTAGHGGRFAIVTQSVPGLLSIPYSPEEVKAIESACQVKLYISASEDFTAGELETALGTRTGRTVSRTKDAHDIGFGGGSATRSTEDRPLLSKQEIRDMDPDKIVILPERQNPIFADRIKYYESKAIMEIHAAQDGVDYPFPEEDKSYTPVTMKDTRALAKDAADKEAEVVEDANEKMDEPRGEQTVVSLNLRKKTKVKAVGSISSVSNQNVNDLTDECMDILARWDSDN
jgi:type IV secretion system protein VirD4